MANRDIVTSSGKGASLSGSNYDQNVNSLNGTVETQTGATYTVVYTDQGKTILLNNASMVCTLDAIATITAAIDTDSFNVALKNINAADATVQRSSTNTIDAATSITLKQNDSVVLQVEGSGSSWKVLVDNMDVAKKTSPTLTSPVLNTQATGTAIKDEDDMSSDSATHLCTQQSIKAYVDSKQPVVLDTPAVLATITSATSGFVTLDMSTAYAAAATAGATSAEIKCVITISVASAGADSTVFLRKTGSGAAAGIVTQACRARVTAIGATAMTVSDVATTTVGLDSNSDFDYQVTGSGSFSADIVLVSYKTT